MSYKKKLCVYMSFKIKQHIYTSVISWWVDDPLIHSLTCFVHLITEMEPKRIWKNRDFIMALCTCDERQVLTIFQFQTSMYISALQWNQHQQIGSKFRHRYACGCVRMCVRMCVRRFLENKNWTKWTNSRENDATNLQYWIKMNLRHRKSVNSSISSRIVGENAGNIIEKAVDKRSQKV